MRPFEHHQTFTALCRAIEHIAMTDFEERPDLGDMWADHAWEDLVGSSKSTWRRKACEGLGIDYNAFIATYKEMVLCDGFESPFSE